MTRVVPSTVQVRRATRPLSGTVEVPSDKSLSHRAVLFGALAEGVTHASGVLDSADVRSTIEAVSALGAVVTVAAGRRGLDVTVEGWGPRGPVAPDGPIDCGNSGTTVRLLAGILAGWPLSVELRGDASLSARPMGRIAHPLVAMGAQVITTDGHLPVTIAGGVLRPIDYASPVASAQVKSAVLLAGLRAQGRTSVTEPTLSRDHTERLLPAFGVDVLVAHDACRASVEGPAVLSATDVTVPADPSSAAFPVIAALLVRGSEVHLPGVCVNPTRTGFLRVLERMGADVHEVRRRSVGGEPVADLVARHGAALRPVTVNASEVPALVDEVPILAVAACMAEGVSRFEGVGELRVKESDRLEATVYALSALGAEVRAGEDWLEVRGPARLRGAQLSSLGDHRLAMAWAVAGLAAEGITTIEGFDAVCVSYPGFLDDLAALGADL